MKQVNGTPVEKGMRARIVRLLQHHEAAAAALRTTLELVDTAAAEVKASRPPYNIINKALVLDATRRKAQPKRPKLSVEMKKAQRHRTAAILAKYDRTTPKDATIAGKSAGILVTRGYLTWKGDGYVRTAKEFIP
jgi:hypothetical protein